MGPEWVVVIILAVVVLLIAAFTRRSERDGSTAGHYDPDAIGRYVMDPATQSYHYELPTLPRSGGPASPGSGPPHRRRRRRRRTDAEGG